MKTISSHISPTSYLRKRFTLIEPLVDDTCFTWDTTKKMMRDER